MECSHPGFDEQDRPQLSFQGVHFPSLQHLKLCVQSLIFSPANISALISPKIENREMYPAESFDTPLPELKTLSIEALQVRIQPSQHPDLQVTLIAVLVICTCCKSYNASCCATR